MALRKKEYSKITLCDLSTCIMSNLERTDEFRAASCIALYHALPGEVQTADFIEKWYLKKQLLLPVVEGNDLRLIAYTGPEAVQKGAFGILEPIEIKANNEKREGHEFSLSPEEVSACEKKPFFSKEKAIDLIIVPGIAFDRQKNRMGRGKGYYDRLLATLSIPKIGIGFDFQVFDQIPTEPFDKKMDVLITEKEVIR